MAGRQRQPDDIAGRHQHPAGIVKDGTVRQTGCDRASLGYCALSRGGLVLEVDSTAERLLGTDRRALRGRPFAQLVTPEDQDTYRQCQERLATSREPQVCNLSLVCGSGLLPIRLELTVAGDGEVTPAYRAVFCDITERQQAEADLHESASRADYLLSTSPAVIYTCSPTPPYAATYVSPNITAVFGYTPDEFLTTPGFWADRVHPEDRDRVFAGLSDPFAQGGLSYDYRFLHQDGTWRWVRDATRVAWGPDGQPAELVGYLVDDTARKETEVEHAAVLEMAMDGFWLLDTQGRLLQVNAAYCRMSGYDAPELLGMHVSDLEAMEDAEATAAHLRRLVERGEARFESRHRRKDGSVYDIEVSAQYIPVAGGRFVGFARDITSRKQADEELRKAYEGLEQQVAERTRELEQANRDLAAEIVRCRQTEEALREGERGFRSIVERLPLTIYVTTTMDQVCEYVNPTFTELFGYAREEVPSVERWWPLAYPDEPYRRQVSEEWNRRARRAIDTQSSIEPLETTVTCRDGSKRDISWGYIALGRKAFAYGLDLTDHKRAEVAKAKLDAQAWQLQKSESLGRMAGAIAHHLSNDLQAVIGNLELALDEVPRGGEAREMLDEAMQAAHKAAEVSSLMRVYLGQTFADCALLDLSDTCLRRLPLLLAASPKGVTIQTDFPRPGPVISANASHIEQVLANLVTNAWEAIGDRQGTIRLAVKTVRAVDIPAENRFPVNFAEREGSYACLEVADTGCGIERESLRDIFDPFFSTKFTGRGMGLAAVLGIVRAHQGAVAAESQPSKGSVFRVYLPLSAEGIRRPPEPTIQAPETQGRGTVLVVEDEESIRKLSVTVLARLGLDVLEARDGIEAVEIFRQHADEIRLVLCDLTMPRLDGWGTLLALRKIRPGIRVVLASGHDESEVMAGDHPELPDAFLSKPYLRAQLCDVVRPYLGSPLRRT